MPIQGKLVGWCKHAEVVFDPYPGPKTECEACYEKHYLQKRRMFGPCNHEWCDGRYFFEYNKYLDHMNHSEEIS